MLPFNQSIIMAGIQLPQYAEFSPDGEDPTLPSKWNDWLDGFEAMIRAMSVKEDKDKCAMFLHYMGSSTRKLLKKLDDNGVEDEDFKQAKTALTSYFAPKMNRVYIMNSIQQLHQKQGESMDNFHMKVKEKIDLLNLAELSVPLISDLLTLSQLVNNTAHSSLRRKALKDGSSLKDFLKEARAFERAEAQSKEIERFTTDRMSSQINAIQDTQQKKCYRCGGNFPHNRKCPGKKQLCWFCGGSFPHKDRKCPARDSTCTKCNKLGHSSAACRSSQIKMVTAADDSDDEYLVVPYVVYAVGNVAPQKSDIIVNGQNVECIIDTGAQVNVLSEKSLNKLNIKSSDLQPSVKKLCAYGPNKEKNVLPIIGRINTVIKSSTTGKEIEAEFHILGGVADNLLSCSSSVALGLVTFPHSINAVSSSEIREKFADRFSGIGKMKDIQIKLLIKESVKPIQQRTR